MHARVWQNIKDTLTEENERLIHYALTAHRLEYNDVIIRFKLAGLNVQKATVSLPLVSDLKTTVESRIINELIEFVHLYKVINTFYSHV
jgi:hypothetical protein